MSTERELYEPIRIALVEEFKKRFDSCKIYKTHNKLDDRVKKELRDEELFFIRGEKLFPDLMGFAEKKIKDIDDAGLGYTIIAEVKNEKIKIRGIYQAKMYSEFFGADFCFLISSEPISEEMKRIIKLKPSITSCQAGYKTIILAQFDEKTKEILTDKELYPRDVYEV